ncbi:protealysin inhibitor emfourin [Catellatospora paridis]|uniref:protealysin inhibitor emfourin n=1 Tax=Catellatospora paridis TaxID=1617086 RepID=UPI0012D3F7F5|nr:protealysin inhibitor emfourin [Catellatospora paridis]
MNEAPPAGNRPAIRAVQRHMTALRIAALAALLSLTTACASGPADPGASPGPGGWVSPSPASVVVHRTGGFAGVDDQITVDPAGAWTATDRARTSKSGKLTTSEREQLQTLAADPRLDTEAARPTTPTNCADAFQYTVTVDRTGDPGTVTVTFTDCPGDENLPEAAAAIANLVTGAVDS